jgi:ubiquinone/menaquinone biosynthesis C-methylase UbiE
MKANLVQAPDLQQAKRYEAWFSTPFGGRADRVEKLILRGLLADFTESHSLLDVGCGTGHFTGWFADPGLSAVGLDRSPSMLTFARDRRPDTPFVLGDATSLPFSEDAFDIVALVNVIEFLSSPEIALREAGRVARHGLLLGVLNSLSPVALWRRARRATAYRGTRFFSPVQLDLLLRTSLGRRVTEIHRRTGLYPVPWLDGFTDLPLGAFIGLSARFEEGG